MKHLFKTAALAALMLGASQPLYAKPAPAAAPAAPAAGGVVAQGIGVANLDLVIANSAAYKTAQVQRPVTYKAQIDAAEARRKQLADQITPMINKLKADSQLPKPDQASLQAQSNAIQALNESGGKELQNMLAPVAMSEAYVEEQINDVLPKAIQNAMTKQRVTLLVNPQAVLAAANGYNLNQSILSELNTLLPTAQLVPPAGWEPREVREAKAQQAASQGQAAPAAATGPSAQPAPGKPSVY